MEIIAKYAYLKAALICQAKNDVRYYLNGINFMADGRMASTDGHCLFKGFHESTITNSVIIKIKGAVPARFERAVITLPDSVDGDVSVRELPLVRRLQMTVTKRQQLEWLAKNCESWPVMSEFIIMHGTNLGICGSCWEITLEEWQQERDKMQKQSAQQVQSAQPAPDNSWHERGEFPPAGCECEVFVSDENKWMHFEVIAIRDGHVLGWCREGSCGFQSNDISDFRPLHTEREKAIDAACAAVCKAGPYDHERELIGKLYDAGMLK